MVQESPTEPDPSETNDEEGEDESSVEEAVDEAVSEAEDRRDDARETVEETGEEAGATVAEKTSETSDQVSEKASETTEQVSEKTSQATEQVSEKASQATDQVSEKTDELSEKTEEMAEKTEVIVETAPNEEAALRRVRAVSKLLDDAVRIPGTNFRVGIDPVLGILPGAGDAVATALALYPVAEAYRLDAPPELIGKMLSLIAVDFVLGSVPVVGTLFDAFWKANEWNARALERHLEGV